MWDLMHDLAVKNGWLAKPKRPSFARDILPIFERIAGLQWVNEGFAAGFGWNGVFELTAETITRLARPNPADAAWRKAIVNQFPSPAASIGLIPSTAGRRCRGPGSMATR